MIIELSPCKPSALSVEPFSFCCILFFIVLIYNVGHNVLSALNTLLASKDTFVLLAGIKTAVMQIIVLRGSSMLFHFSGVTATKVMKMPLFHC